PDEYVPGHVSAGFRVAVERMATIRGDLVGARFAHVMQQRCGPGDQVSRRLVDCADGVLEHVPPVEPTLLHADHRFELGKHVNKHAALVEHAQAATRKLGNQESLYLIADALGAQDAYAMCLLAH